MVLEEIKRLSGEVDCIVLAQGSMAVLEKDTANNSVPVYSSPRLAFQRARAMLEAMQ